MEHLRENAAGAVTMKDVQQLFANQGGQGMRGVFPPGKLNQNFDAQSAQINATHKTKDLAQASPAKRPRARISKS